jgi:hypothetical protein
MPVLRLNFMSKCYPIERRLQTTGAPAPNRHASFVPQFITDAMQGNICVFFM